MKVRVQKWVGISLAASVWLSTGQMMAAIPTGNINTTNDGRIISGGTYYNTSTGITTFINSGSGGLWLKSGNTVRGEEVTSTGQLTDNGGNLHLYAPNQVVRIDGNLDVSGLLTGQGNPIILGNGGKVFIDAGYLFQNGNIYANGYGGGSVQINVGGMTLGQGAQIQTNNTLVGTSNPSGSIISINSSGPVDLRKNSLIQTSAFYPSSGTDEISIEGSLINVDGIIKANSAQYNNNEGGEIRLDATRQSNLPNLENILQTATHNTPGDSSAPTLSAQDRTFILQRMSNQIQSHDGDVAINRDTQNAVPTYMGQLDASGSVGANAVSEAGNGGIIIVTAMHDIDNQGQILADGAPGNGNYQDSSYGNGIEGGAGGTIALVAMNNILNDKGVIEANGGNGSTQPDTVTGSGSTFGGNGGYGGLIAFGYHTDMTNTGTISANGGIGANFTVPNFVTQSGNAGLIEFSGNNNPTGNGNINVIASVGGNNDLLTRGQPGSIVTPNSSTLGQSQVSSSQATILQTQTNEALTNNGVLILLTQNGGASDENLFSRMLNATYRSTGEQQGITSGLAPSLVQSNSDFGNVYTHFIDLVVGSSQDNLPLNLSLPANYVSLLNNDSQVFQYLGSLNIVNNGPVIFPTVNGPFQTFSPSLNNFWTGSHVVYTPGVSRVSILANGDITNSSDVIWAGTINMATKGSYIGGGILETSDSYAIGQSSLPYSELDGGSIMIKAGNNITQNTEDGSYLAAKGNLLGGVIQLSALNDITYDASDFSNKGTTSAISADGTLQGGIIDLQAGHHILMNANATQRTGSQISQIIAADGTLPSAGRGGFINLNAPVLQINNIFIQANGTFKSGTVNLNE